MKTLLMLTLITLGRIGISHEGHDIPGALPPPPHGGVVQEAGHAGADHHHGKEEKELFFEVTYKDNELKIYPLTIPAENTKTFVTVSPKTALTKVEVKAENPRTKKTEKLNSTIEGNFIKAGFDSKGANRFIVHVGAEFEKEMKLAKVQIERK